MHDFTHSTWTIEDTERARERFARMDDEKILKTMEAAAYMCSPKAYWGTGPRQSYVIQRELVRLEICRRGAALEDLGRS